MKKIDLNAVRVLRGGSWSYNASALRAAYRSGYSPSYQSNYIGARLARRFVRAKK